MKHNKLFPQRYKTFAGAAKRAQFERAMNPSEFRSGHAARLYVFRVVEHEGAYRVERSLPTAAAAE